MKEALIIIPAYNEEKNISKVINDIKCNTKNFDYIIKPKKYVKSTNMI